MSATVAVHMTALPQLTHMARLTRCPSFSNNQAAIVALAPTQVSRLAQRYQRQCATNSATAPWRSACSGVQGRVGRARPGRRCTCLPDSGSGAWLVTRSRNPWPPNPAGLADR